MPRQNAARRGAALRGGVVAAVAIVCAGPAVGGRMAARRTAAVEIVQFPGRHQVRIVRGGAPARPQRRRVAAVGERIEILRFGARGRVTVVRGGVQPPPLPPPRRADNRAPAVEVVRFADARFAPVRIVREHPAVSAPPAIALFAPADIGELDRIAFAVDGVESRHGADLAMWRPAPAAPQGPMQVSLAAATDVGGGDRFDVAENRLLGRAYLAQMFRRYGNWPDALAAYNWGPANVDKWIAGGRDPAELPPGVAWYIRRVLHDALLTAAASR